MRFSSGRTSSAKAAVVGVAAIVVGSGLTGCAASYAGVSCSFNLANVHESSGSPGWMDVKAKGSCGGAANSATVTVCIQKQVGGKWVDVAGSRATREIAPVVKDKQYTAMSSTTTRCANGTYRGAPTGTLTAKGKTSPSFQTGYGPVATVK